MNGHMQKIDGINHDSWSRDDLKHELNRAISLLDHAEDEYDEALEYFSSSTHSSVFGTGKKPAKKSSSVNNSIKSFWAPFFTVESSS